jgi:hypothetical protein
MPIDIEKLSTPQIETLIQNHRTKKATEAPLYADALRELEKRKGKGLDFDKSLSIIWQAAREGRYLSYKELADASGADWLQVHYEVGRTPLETCGVCPSKEIADVERHRREQAEH